MREEAALTAHHAEGARLRAVELGAHRFAIVFQHHQAMLVGQGADGGEIVGVPQQVDAKDRPSARSDGRGQGLEIEVKRPKIDIDEAQTQPVLLKRAVRCAPRNRRNEHLVTFVQAQRWVCGISQRRNHQQVSRRAGIAHHRMAGTGISGEGALALLDLRAHSELTGCHRVLDRPELRLVPRRCREREARCHCAVPCWL